MDLTYQWTVDGTRWWFKSGDPPLLQETFLVLGSAESEGAGTKSLQEAQVLEDHALAALPDSGEFVVGYWSSRWNAVPADTAYWADSSVCLEVFSTPHYGICFTFGNLGVFADYDGQCKDDRSRCRYQAVRGWSELKSTTSPLSIRIRWSAAGDGTKTFELYVNDEGTPRAVVDSVDYMDAAEGLRTRLNANVTEDVGKPRRPPAEDSDTLLVDYVCID